MSVIDYYTTNIPFSRVYCVIRASARQFRVVKIAKKSEKKIPEVVYSSVGMVAQVVEDTIPA